MLVTFTYVIVYSKTTMLASVWYHNYTNKKGSCLRMGKHREEHMQQYLLWLEDKSFRSIAQTMPMARRHEYYHICKLVDTITRHTAWVRPWMCSQTSWSLDEWNGLRVKDSFLNFDMLTYYCSIYFTIIKLIYCTIIIYCKMQILLVWICVEKYSDI